MWTPYSVWFLEERKGHLKIILLSSSCVKDCRIKRQTRNKYNMYVFFKDFSFFHSFCSSLAVFQLSVCMDRGRGVVKQEVDRCDDVERGSPLFSMCIV